MNSLVVYEPMIVVTLYSGKKIYLPASKREALKKQMQTEKFIDTQWVIFAVSAIENIDNVDNSTLDQERSKDEEKNMVESLIAELSPDKRIKVRELVMIWKEENKCKILKKGIVKNMVESVLQ